jgi:S1-C subfamily serine protease
MQLTAITPADRKHFGLTYESGVLLDQVMPGSQAEEMGLQSGDVIEQVGDQPATTPGDLATQLKYGDPAPDDHIALLVHGREHTRWFTMYVGRVDVADLLAEPGLLHNSGLASNAEASRP